MWHTVAMSHNRDSDHDEQMSHTLAVGERGRVVIPAELRKALGIGPGSTLIAHLEDGRRLVLEDRQALVAEMRGAWRRPALEVPLNASIEARARLTAELLAERRAEAELEDAKVSGDKGAIARARRRLGEIKRRHDAQRSK